MRRLGRRLRDGARIVARTVRALFAPDNPRRSEPVGCDVDHDLVFKSMSRDGFVWMTCRRCGFDFARHPDDWPTLEGGE